MSKITISVESEIKFEIDLTGFSTTIPAEEIQSSIQEAVNTQLTKYKGDANLDGANCLSRSVTPSTISFSFNAILKLGRGVSVADLCFEFQVDEDGKSVKMTGFKTENGCGGYDQY